MKLKKKQFKRLKEIAFTANQIVSGTGVALDKLISDIESVQKPKEEFGFIDTDQLKKDFRPGSPFFESLKEEARDMFFKEGKNAVENNRSVGNMTKGLRAQVKQHDTLPGEEPKIGDIGYFWDLNQNYPVVYGRLRSIHEGNGQDHFGNWHKNFSKTPPELR